MFTNSENWDLELKLNIFMGKKLKESGFSWFYVEPFDS